MAAARTCSVLLWLLAALFALRVLGQAVQRWWPQSLLPDFDAFQGSRLPYGFLLTVQLVILAVMIGVSWRVHRRTLPTSTRAARLLLWFGSVYMTGSLARIAFGLAAESAPAWFRAWIPASFHVVLAAYVLALAYYHRQRL
jgi:hypothetical protein